MNWATIIGRREGGIHKIQRKHKNIKYMQKVKSTTKMREGGIRQIQRKTYKHPIYCFLCGLTKKANIYSTSKLAIVESKF